MVNNMQQRDIVHVTGNGMHLEALATVFIFMMSVFEVRPQGSKRNGNSALSRRRPRDPDKDVPRVLAVRLRRAGGTAGHRLIRKNAWTLAARSKGMPSMVACVCDHSVPRGKAMISLPLLQLASPYLS